LHGLVFSRQILQDIKSWLYCIRRICNEWQYTLHLVACNRWRIIHTCWKYNMYCVY